MNDDSLDEDIPTEFETDNPCPACGSKLYFIFYRTRITYEEAVEIETFFCKKCLYKSTQVRQIEREEPKTLVLEIRNHDDIRTILYRSPEAKIQIPELEAEIEPGEISTGEITTVEGILSHILEKLQLFDDNDTDPDSLARITKRIRGIIDGSGEKFTFVMEDPMGKSRINSGRVIVLKHTD